jgi:hypothetical protein
MCKQRVEKGDLINVIYEAATVEGPHDGTPAVLAEGDREDNARRICV